MRDSELKKYVKRDINEPRSDRFEVVVGNIGSVYSGNSLSIALDLFDTYVNQSKSGVGRAGGEFVTLFKYGEPYKEFIGDIDKRGDF